MPRPSYFARAEAPAYKHISSLMAFLLVFSLLSVIAQPPAAHAASAAPARIASGGTHSVVVKSDGTVWAWGENQYGELGDGTTSDTGTPVQVAGIANAISATAGENHSVVVKADGSVWSWGENFDGQLGNGTTTGSIAPVQVKGPGGTGFLVDAITVAAGEGHTLALKSDGTVWAWGDNTSGELGNGTINDTSTPVQVAGLTGVIAIAAGDWHSLALKSDGTVWAWGWGGRGELGNGAMGGFVKSTTPIQVIGPGSSGYLTDIIAIAAGEYHSLAVKTDGTVWAWGDNSQGQLGDGTTNDMAAPVQVTGLTGVVAVAAGYGHSLALKSDGTVYSWGNNDRGQLGDNTWTDEDKVTPVQVAGLTGAVAITAGDHYAMSLRADGSIALWGDNANGELGSGTIPSADATAPASVKDFDGEGALSGILGIAAGGEHSLAMATDGSIFTWGHNNYGQLGVMAGNNSALPVAIPGLTNAAMVAGISNYGAAIKTDGTLWMWGNNYFFDWTFMDTFELIDTATPERISGLANVDGVSLGGSHVVIVKGDGTVWAWGDNQYGQLGNDSWETTLTPVQAAGLVDVTATAAGNNHTLAITSDGTVWSWGQNDYGQLGDGTFDSTPTPQQVPGLTNIVAVSAGELHSLALKSDGTVWAWGENFAGQLGDGTTDDTNTPIQVPGIADAVAISAGGSHSLAITSDGTVWAWGYNNHGQLGDGTTDDSASPAQVPGITGAVSVAAGGEHSLALKSDGTLYAWGNNCFGQLGTGGVSLNQSSSDTSITATDAGEPTWSPECTLTATGITQTGATLSWTGAWDDTIITGYRIYVNDVLVASAARHASSYSAGGLSPGTNYTFKIEAGDAAGNWSNTGPSLAVMTQSQSGGGPGGGSGGDEPPSNEETATPEDTTTISFSDVPLTHWAYPQISNLAKQGIVAGYEDGTFHPDAPITRAEFAKMICLTMDWALESNGSSSFSDCRVTNWSHRYVETVKTRGAILGYHGGVFLPNKHITRAELAKIVALSLSLSASTSSFKDVATSWAQTYIAACAGAGIITGYENGTFKPGNTATRAEVAKLLVSAQALHTNR